MLALPQQPGQLLPLPLQHVWRASELAVCRATTTGTGFKTLDAELPNGGWPRSTLVELLLQQAGIGEMQLLKPVLAKLSKNLKVALVHPPYLPQAMACTCWNINTRNLLWVKAAGTADALWSTEQILKNGSCGAVVLWQSQVRAESLRRLNLAAQSTDTWLWLMRPWSCGMDPSPAPLRIALRPALGGVALDIVKRRGPRLEHPLFIALADMPAAPLLLEQENAPVVQRLPAFVASRNTPPILV